MTISKKLLALITFGFLCIPHITLTNEKPNQSHSIITFDSADESVVGLCYKKYPWPNEEKYSFRQNKEKYNYCNVVFGDKKNGTLRSIIYENNKQAGFINYRINDEKKGHISYFIISEDYRRKGYGEALLTQSIKELQNKGAKSIDLYVIENNIPALALYKKAGFKKMANQQDMPEGMLCLEYDQSLLQAALSH